MSFIKLFSREYSVQYTEASIRSIEKFVPSQAYVPEQGNEACYADEVEWEAFIKKLSNAHSSPRQVAAFAKKFHASGIHYTATAKKITKIACRKRKVSDATMIRLYETYQKALIHYSAYVWFGYYLNSIYSEKIKIMIAPKKRKNAHHFLPSLLTPIKKCGVLSLQNALSVYKKSKMGISQKQLAVIEKKYRWMSCLDIHNEPWTREDIFRFFEHLQLSTSIIPFSKVSTQMSLTKAEKKLVVSARTLVYIKDMRDEYRRKGICEVLPFFDEIARRLSCMRVDLAYMTFAEIVMSLRANACVVMPEQVRQRRAGFLIYKKGRKLITTTSAQDVDGFMRAHAKTKTVSPEVHGVVASRGSAKGVVRIVLGVKDLQKVMPGDVMVAITTHPDFVSAMHRASAIVTDEGGITSHAAIVSRELRKPCIVGTKSATKNLSDGQYVEVDGITGNVRVLRGREPSLAKPHPLATL